MPQFVRNRQKAPELKPFWTSVDGETVRLYQGNVIDVLRRMPSSAVQMVVTSPPYWALRDYGTGAWDGGREDCDHMMPRGVPRSERRKPGETHNVTKGGNTHEAQEVRQYERVCAKCGAKRVDHQLGSEESPDCLGWARGWNCADDNSWVGGTKACQHKHTQIVQMRGQATDVFVGGNPNCDHKQEDVGTTTESFSSTHGKMMSRPAGWHGSPRCSTVKPGGTCVKCGAQRVYDVTDVEECVTCGARRGNWETGCHVCRMQLVFREVRRVLRNDGTLWLNYGDTYSSGVSNNRNGISSTLGCSQKANNPSLGAKACDIPSGNMVGIPWRVAFALQADGWILRQDIIWVKKSPMPESVRNRCTKSHEYVFLLAKKMGYFFDGDAIREPLSAPTNLIRTAENGMGNGELGSGMRFGSPDPNGRNKRSVWTVSSQGYSGAHFACVDDETEALTPTGWKRRVEMKDGDVILAFDRDRGLVWQPATFHAYVYDGEMVSINKRDASQLLTPNHRCLVRRRTRRGGYVQDVVQASQLNTRMDLVTFGTWGADKTRVVGRDFAELIGWYITEGSAPTKKDKAIMIYQSQSANPDKVIRIRGLLQSLQATWTEYTRERIVRGKRSVEVVFRLVGWIVQELVAACPDKMIPEWCHELPEDEAQAMMAGVVEGDGCRRRDRRSSVIQKVLAGIERMQVLAIRCGYRAHISKRKDRDMYNLFLTRGETITVRKPGGISLDVGRVHYKGVVWCPSVAAGFWLARRNGKPFVTGNTFPEKLIEPCILAGTSAHGACAKCGAPWKRTLRTCYVPCGDNKDRKRGGVANDRPDDPTHKLKGKITPQEMRYGRARRVDDMLGWEPTCTCHGHFVRQEADAIHYGAWSNGEEREHGNVAWKDCNMEPQIIRKEVDVYVPDIPLDEHPIRPCIVMDIFIGSGTTCVNSLKHGRYSWGIDLSVKYLTENAIPRIEGRIRSLNRADLMPKIKVQAVELGGVSSADD